MPDKSRRFTIPSTNPKTSSGVLEDLVGTPPEAPAVPAPAAGPAGAGEPAQESQQAAGQAAAPQRQVARKAQAAPAPRTAAAPKLNAYVAAEVQDAARRAVYWTRNQPDGGYETLSELVEDALRAKVAELEAQFNDGKPFAPMPNRKLRAGRPIGS